MEPNAWEIKIAACCRLRQLGLPGRLFAFLVLIFAALANAQEETGFASSPGKFSCTGLGSASFPSPENEGLNGRTFLKLESKPGAIPADAKLNRFGPFDESRFGFSSVEFYQFLTGDPQEGLQTNTDAHLFVRLAGNHGGTWYGFPGKDARVDTAGMPQQNEDNASGAEVNHPPKAAPDAPIQISMAEPAIPLFELSYGSRWLGANASGTFENTMVVDLRKLPPQLAAHMQCVAGEGGGVCTAVDAGYQSRTEAECSWESAQADYRCHSQTVTDSRKLGSYFFLLSDKDAYEPKPDTPHDLSEFARRMRDDPGWLHRTAEVEGFGETTPILALRANDPARWVVLFGSRGGGKQMNARFFLTTLEQDKKPVVIDLNQGPHEQGTSEASNNPELVNNYAPREIPSGDPLSFDAKAIHVQPGLRIIQVVVTEGKSHAVYWAGIDTRTGATNADVLRLAVDSSYYDHCGEFIHEGGSTAVQIAHSPFSAELLAEPNFRTDQEEKLVNEGEALPASYCPQRKQLTWAGKPGFIMHDLDTPCPNRRRPRVVTINSDGSVKMTPYSPPSPARR